MNMQIANTDPEIGACYPVMRELRPDIAEKSFVQKVRELQKYGYQLAYLEESGKPVAVAGFRVSESLAWKRYLYVDDLVTLSNERSKGHGALLIKWLAELASRQGCEQFHLDSGVQRKDAHRFYGREGFQLPSYHFAKHVTPDAASEKEAR
jgi:GNAT superfamily N-acetyltransferase